MSNIFVTVYVVKRSLMHIRHLGVVVMTQLGAVICLRYMALYNFDLIYLCISPFN